MLEIVLMCIESKKCDSTEGTYFINTFTQFPGPSSSPIYAEMSYAAVPGTKYRVEMRGLFPQLSESRHTNQNMISFSAKDKLISVDTSKVDCR